MKIILFVLLVSSICYQTAFGQPKELIPIPFLKESKAIDRLLDKVLDSVNALQDFAMILHLARTDSDFLFEIRTETRKNINAMFNYPQQGKISFGYFAYKGTDVFVADFDDFGGFFSNTSHFKTLNFIYRLKEPSFDLPDGLSPKGSRVWQFKYKNGHFLKWPDKIPEELLITH
ncbi:MAG: hypothetical protein JSU01_10385 [Bacteroidetes bacterium]|nr:hypothetical protein [Bacteroidota bacterium]